MQAAPGSDRPPRAYSTEVAAAAFGVKAHTLRVSCSQHGHYLGVRPVKLPNRRLLWPADQVDALVTGQRVAA
jgi:hypothetical protein